MRDFGETVGNFRRWAIVSTCVLAAALALARFCGPSQTMSYVVGLILGPTLFIWAIFIAYLELWKGFKQPQPLPVLHKRARRVALKWLIVTVVVWPLGLIARDWLGDAGLDGPRLGAVIFIPIMLAFLVLAWSTVCVFLFRND